MSLIQLKGEAAEKYRRWLRIYEEKTGKKDTYLQRTEAFFCSISADPAKKPWWIDG